MFPPERFGIISVDSINLVSSSGTTADRWEPSGASGTTWAASWAVLQISDGFVSVWHGSGWRSGTSVKPANTFGPADINLSWDSVRSRFVYVLVAEDFSLNKNLYYGWSDSSGNSWTPPAMVLAGDELGQLRWDYPSVAIASDGRVIIGAVKQTGNPPINPTGLYSIISLDGVSFSSPSCVFGQDAPTPGRERPPARSAA